MSDFEDMEARRIPMPWASRPPKAPISELERSARSVRAQQSRLRGVEGERQVARLWVRNGWPHARRQPGSGSIRWHVGEIPPMPGDIRGIDPWVCEVKYNAQVGRPGRHGLYGEGFIRATLKDFQTTLRQYDRAYGMAPRRACAFFRYRGPHHDPVQWRIFLPEDEFTRPFIPVRQQFTPMIRLCEDFSYPPAWVEIDEQTFFNHYAVLLDMASTRQ